MLARGAPVCDTPGAGRRTARSDADEAGAVVMETCAGPRAAARPGTPSRCTAWGDPDHVLPAGTTSAWLVAVTGRSDPALAAGDLLVLADCPAGQPEDVRLGDPAAPVRGPAGP